MSVLSASNKIKIAGNRTTFEDSSFSPPDHRQGETKHKDSLQATPGHIAFRLSEDFADSHSKLTMKLLLNEIEELKLNDITVKQRTD